MSISGGKTPAIGTAAPELGLRDTHGTTIELSDLRGAPALLVFYPFAFTGTCHGELCELRDDLSVFSDLGVRVLAISCDPMFALKAWNEQEEFGFDLLSDFWPHGKVAQAYGVFNAEAGRAERGSFLLDAEGLVRWSVVNDPGQARSIADYQAAIAAL